MPFIVRIAAAIQAFFVVLVVGADEAQARVVVREKTTYYKVSGRTGADIYDQILRKGPRLKGRKEHLVATATFDFDFDTRTLKASIAGGTCRITDIDVIVKVAYRMPQWTDEQRARPAVRRAWKEFVDFVWKHEKRHTEIARDAANEMLRALKGARGDARRECAGIADGLKDKVRAVVRRHDRRQKEFDDSPWGIGGQVFHFDRKLIAAK